MDRRRLILHVGMPKTGTTALQRFFVAERDALKGSGILYPTYGTTDRVGAQQHRWTYESLLAGDARRFAACLKLAEDECDARTHTIVLSSENLSLYWMDFSPDARRWLAALADTYEIVVWLWLREPGDFLRSAYIESLMIHRVEGYPSFGADQDVAEFLNDPWVARLFDYRERCRSIASVFGDDALYVFAYDTEIVRTVCRLLAFDVSLPNERHNVTSYGAAGVAIRRLVNRYTFTAEQADRVNNLVADLQGAIGPQGEPFETTDHERSRARELCSMSGEEIERASEESRRRWLATAKPTSVH